MSAALKFPVAAVVPNRHKVPLKAWRKWTHNQQVRFNRIYERLLHAPDVICPNGMTPTATEWKVVAWNCAWLATDELEF